MVIKTLASFSARPLLWFGLLAVPLLIVGFSLLGYALTASLLSNAATSLPIAGSGVIFLTSAFILLFSGALGELVYNLSDMREHDFARLTQRVGARTVATGIEAQ
jgi:hypothetical protein